MVEVEAEFSHKPPIRREKYRSELVFFLFTFSGAYLQGNAPVEFTFKTFPTKPLLDSLIEAVEPLLMPDGVHG